METAKITDNFYNDFPARMADGRFITDYTPNCMLNTLRKEKMSAWEYRTHLINNTDQIMQEINAKNESMYGCQECHRTVLPSPNAKQVCTETGCEIIQIDPQGVGLEQEY